jgi:hypothetical protein
MCTYRVLVAGLVASAAVSHAGAQAVRVELRDSVGRSPVIGALVSATDASGQVRADGLTNDRGVVTLKVPTPGDWNISVRRIGVTPRIVPAVRVADGATVTVSLALNSIRQRLSEVRVTADAGVCGRAPTGDDRMSVLWEQISLALRASTISRADSTNSAPLLIVERVRELSEQLVERETRITRNGYGAGRPYAAIDPGTLAQRGYIIRESDGGLRYFAPDEVVLLSESFLATHCFSTPKKDEDPTLAELRFKPVRGRKLADVQGTVFVDTLSGELRRIEFRYVAPRDLIPRDSKYTGGDVALARLSNGQWIVSSWAIRMPHIEQVGVTRPRHYIRGFREVGGTVDPVAETKRPD